MPAGLSSSPPSPTRAGDPLAALLDQILADRHADQIARARQAVAAIRARLAAP